MSAVTRTKFFIALISLAGDVKRREVDGWTIGPFGVHRESYGMWSVSHLPTGLRVFRRRSRAVAIKDAIRACEIAFDWLRPGMLRFGRHPHNRILRAARLSLYAHGVSA